MEGEIITCFDDVLIVIILIDYILIYSVVLLYSLMHVQAIHNMCEVTINNA